MIAPAPGGGGLPEALASAPGFYTHMPDGDRRCRLCQGPQGTHAPACPLIALRIQVQELGAQLGLYVATMRELLDTVDGLLRGDPGAPSEGSA